MRSPFRGRKILVAAWMLVLLAAVVLTTLPSSEVEAAANCTYYSNASHAVMVGQFGYDCCNNRVAWGHKTQFAVCGGCFTCYPPPR